MPMKEKKENCKKKQKKKLISWPRECKGHIASLKQAKDKINKYPIDYFIV